MKSIKIYFILVLGFLFLDILNAQNNERIGKDIQLNSFNVTGDSLVPVVVPVNPVASGTLAKITAKVINNGSAASDSTALDYYLSKDTYINGDDYFLGSAKLPSIPAGGSRLVELEFNMPSSIPVNNKNSNPFYYIGWIVDGVPFCLNSGPHLIKSDCISIIQILTTPNPPKIIPGASLTVKALLKNYATGGNQKVQSIDFIITNTDYVNSPVITNTIEDGTALDHDSTRQYETSFNFPADFPVGNYYISFNAHFTGCGNFTPDQFYFTDVAPVGTSTLTVKQKPTVTLNGFSNLTSSSVLFNGFVNANNSNTNIYFEWGTTAAYGNQTSSFPSTLSGTNTTDVSGSVTTLLPNTTYHFRLIAVNDMGATYSEDQIFTSATAPPVVTTVAANPVSYTTATLNGTVNPNNSSTVAKFKYGTSTSYTDSMTTGTYSGYSSSNISLNLTGLIPNTTYHYICLASNSAGTSFGLDQTFKTLKAAPLLISDTATNITSGSVTFNGVVNPNNDSSTVLFKSGTSSGGPYGTTTNTTPNIITGYTNSSIVGTLSGLLPNTTYYYIMQATNGGGTTTYTERSFKTLKAKPVITLDSVSGLAFTSVTLNGYVNPNNDTTGILFEYGTTSAYGFSLSSTPDSFSQYSSVKVSANLTGLTPNTTYHFRIVATNGAGTSYSSDQTFSTPSVAPTVTTTIANNIFPTNATLNGTVNPNNSSITSIYFEYGTSTSYGTNISISGTYNDFTVHVFALNINSLIPNTTYHYRLVATNGFGTSYGSDKSFTTSKMVPTLVIGSVSNLTTTSVTLNGTVNANNDTTYIYFDYGLTIGYGTSKVSNPGTLAGYSGTAVSLNLSGLLPNSTYHYRLVASNSAGTNTSLDQTFTTFAAPPSATTVAASDVLYNSVKINGTINPNNSLSTVSFEYGSTISYGSTITLAGSFNGMTDTNVYANLSGLTDGVTYHYRVVCTNAGGTTYGNDFIFKTILKPTVHGLIAGANTTVSVNPPYPSGIPSNVVLKGDAVSVSNFSVSTDQDVNSSFSIDFYLGSSSNGNYAFKICSKTLASLTTSGYTFPNMQMIVPTDLPKGNYFISYWVDSLNSVVKSATSTTTGQIPVLGSLITNLIIVDYIFSVGSAQIYNMVVPPKSTNIEIPIILDGFNDKIENFNFTISYDTSVLIPVKRLISESFANFSDIKIRFENCGKIHFENFFQNPQKFGGTIGKLFFNAKAQSDTKTIINFDNFTVNNNQPVNITSATIIISSSLGIDKKGSLIRSYALEQNYPNPFNPTTKIKFAVPEKSDVKILVYDLNGKQMKEIVNTNFLNGEYEIIFDANGLPSGVYFYSMQALSLESNKSFTKVKKLLLIK